MINKNTKESIFNKKIFYVLSAVIMFSIGLGVPLGILFLKPSQPIDNTSLVIIHDEDHITGDDEDPISTEPEILSINNGKVSYIGTENPTEILIPEVVKQETVTKIDGSSFPSTLETLVLPNTITEINPGEFSELDSLTSIVINNEDYGTQDGAIYEKDNSGNLTTLVSVPAGKTGEIVYASTLTVIGERAFENTNLDTLTIPSGTTTINAYAFNLTRYEKIILPSTITSLSLNAFAGMGNLSEIVLNSSISAYTLPEITFTGGSFAWYKDGSTPTQVSTMSTSGTYYVGRSAQSQLSDGWTIATIGNKYYVTGVPTPTSALTDKLSIPVTIGSYTITGVGNGTNVITNIGAYRTVELKSGITSINAYAFSGTISSIILPSTVTSIGAHAFQYCGLTSINLSNVTSLGAYAFESNYELVTVTLSNNLTTIPNGAFWVCRKLTTINNLSTSSVNTIGTYAFNSCDSLASISLPSTLRTIGSEAFSGCISLTSITIPSGVTTIPQRCFGDCIKLATVSLPSTITSIGDYAFISTKISTISLPSSLTTIGRYAFSIESLTSITIPSSVTSIGNWCFAGCKLLSSLTMNASVTSIGEGTFSNCTSLKSIDFPATMKQLSSAYAAFQNCTSLTVTLRSTSFIAFGNGSFDGASSIIIKVPSSLVSTYQNASGWSNFTIQAIS